jgi:tetratricopeptide (TPR) repeat protein
MAQENLSDTQQNRTSGNPTQPFKVDDTQPVPVKEKKPRRWRTTLLGILLVLLLGAAGGGLGYQHGIKDRLAKQNQQVLTEAATQFQYGVQQMANGNYNLARTHFEYVFKIYPDFPGLTEKYTEVMVKLAESSIPASLPLATPTLSNLNAEGLFNQATQEVQSMQWEAAMNTLEALRNADTTYRTLEVDGLYFITLRYRAVDMIVKEGNLEEGLYLLSVVNRYAPLDHDAVNYSNWARLYLTGASYWDVDWERVVNYFSQLAAAFPYMHDGTGWTANDRFTKGSEFYGDQLAAAGDHCKAIEYYQTAVNANPTEEIQDKYNSSYLKCHPPTAKPQPTETLDPGIPTDTPTEEPTVEGGGNLPIP